MFKAGIQKKDLDLAQWFETGCPLPLRDAWRAVQRAKQPGERHAALLDAVELLRRWLATVLYAGYREREMPDGEVERLLAQGPAGGEQAWADLLRALLATDDRNVLAWSFTSGPVGTGKATGALQLIWGQVEPLLRAGVPEETAAQLVRRLVGAVEPPESEPLACLDLALAVRRAELTADGPLALLVDEALEAAWHELLLLEPVRRALVRFCWTRPMQPVDLETEGDVLRVQAQTGEGALYVLHGAAAAKVRPLPGYLLRLTGHAGESASPWAPFDWERWLHWPTARLVPAPQPTLAPAADGPAATQVHAELPAAAPTAVDTPAAAQVTAAAELPAAAPTAVDTPAAAALELPGGQADAEARILRLLADSRPRHRSEILEVIPLSEGQWRKAIRSLEDQGAVITQGERRGTTYRVRRGSLAARTVEATPVPEPQRTPRQRRTAEPSSAEAEVAAAGADGADLSPVTPHDLADTAHPSDAAAHVRSGAGTPSEENGGDTIGELAHRVLHFLADGHKQARKEILEATGISEFYWKQVIRRLLEGGKVIQEGERRFTTYHLMSAVAPGSRAVWSEGREEVRVPKPAQQEELPQLLALPAAETLPDAGEAQPE